MNEDQESTRGLEEIANDMELSSESIQDESGTGESIQDESGTREDKELSNHDRDFGLIQNKASDDNDKEQESGKEEGEADSNDEDEQQDKNDDEDDDGEDLMKPSKRNGMGISDDDSDEDEEVCLHRYLLILDKDDVELTEADRKFIADDDEHEDEDPEEKRKRKEERKRKRQEEKELEQLSEDELDLINENIGNNRHKKRLRKKGDGDRDEIADLFDEDEDEEEQEPQKERRSAAFNEAELYDDLDDFIIHDGEDSDEELDEEARDARRIERRQKQLDFSKNIGEEHKISDEAWRDIEELFGTGLDDYPEALYRSKSQPAFFGASTEEDDYGGDEGMVSSTSERKKDFKLADVYEPSEIAAKMLTEKDEFIRVQDIPERMQAQDTTIPDDAEISREATIITKTFLRDRTDVAEKQMHTCVTAVLRFLRRDFFDVPFIYAHRRDYFDGILQLSDLWKIVDLNQKFFKVEERKRILLELIVQIAAQDESIKEDESVADLLAKIITLDDVDDAFAYLHLFYIGQIELVNAKLKKVPSRMTPWKHLYYECTKSGIDEFAKIFNIQSNDFVMSVTGQQSLHFPEDHSELPLVAAAKYTSSKFRTPEKVLDAAKQFIAYQLSVNSSLRAFIRRIYFTDAVITVSPTEKGVKDVDANHPFFPIIYISRKPVHKFIDGQFLQIIKAEQDGLATVEIKIDEEVRLVADLEKFICNDYVNELAVTWNTERKKIAEFAARGILFPQTTRWLKERLSISASEYVAIQCQANLEKKISLGSYKLPDNDEDSPRVLSISWGDGIRNSPAYAVYVNENGEMTDFMQLDRLMERDHSADVEALMDMILRNAPDVIAVGGFKPNTKTVLMKILQEEVLKDGKNIPLFLVDDEVARIYMASAAAAREYPETDYPRLIPYCISLARFVQDPTCESAGLVNKDEDIKHIRLSTLQKMLTDEVMGKAIERSFINVVNHCGVDINAAAMFPHKSHTLQFISGLGPRKAAAFRSKILRTGGKLESRTDLIQSQICAANIFVNCSSFIRIRAVHFRSTYRDSLLDVLDDTRVHPEDYELARKMAADALDLDDAVLEEDESPSQHVQELMEGEVDRLNLLMLDDYAVELERRMHAPKRICLNDIKSELMNPYKDHRREFSGVSLEEAFSMLTGESSETLYEGAVVSTIVVRVKERFLNVQLGSGLEGQLHINNIDVTEGDDLTRIFKENQALVGSVLKINYERMVVELSARESDIASSRPRIRFDEYYNFRAQEMNNNAKLKEKKNVLKTLRTVQHPFWRSFDYSAAEEYLKTRPRGEAIARPSTKGNDHISITWKVYDGIYKHIDVLEKDKPNEWSLGRTLIIDTIKYHDIDQIIAEYIDPMSRRMSMIIDHPKYQRKTLSEMYQFLEEQVQILKKSGYGFIVSPTDPGSFILAYKHPVNTCRKENIVVRPKGYEFRKKIFSHIDQLLGYFKQSEQAKMMGSSNGSSRNGHGHHGSSRSHHAKKF